MPTMILVIERALALLGRFLLAWRDQEDPRAKANPRPITTRPEDAYAPDARRSLLSALLAFALGLGVLALFIPPAEWWRALRQLSAEQVGWSSGWFLLGCLAMTERWRACTAYRIRWGQAWHSLGVAMAGNLLIPGRSGEPLRVYALAKQGVPAGLSTAAVLQERLGDQIFRVVCLVVGWKMAAGSTTPPQGRWVALLLATFGLLTVIGLMVRYRAPLVTHSARWLGRLPRLQASTVEAFLHQALSDLATIHQRPGGLPALFWGGLSFVFFAIHTAILMEPFLGPRAWAWSWWVMVIATPTAIGKPGYYHALVTATLVALSAPSTAALQAAVVLHLFPTLSYPLWGAWGWYALRPRSTTAVPSQ